MGREILIIPVGITPWGLAFNPIDNMMYVANTCFEGDCPATVSVIDEYGLVISTINMGSTPHDIAFNSDSLRLMMYVSSSGGVQRIDGTDRVPILDSCCSKRGIAYNPVNGLMYVADRIDEVVMRIDGNNVIDAIPVGDGPFTGFSYLTQGVAFNPNNNFIYVTNFANGEAGAEVVVIRDDDILSRIPVPEGPYNIAYNPLDTFMYVAHYNGVTMIDGITPVFTIPTVVNRGVLSDIAFNPANGLMYVADGQSSGTVTVLDGRIVVDSISVGDDNRGIAFNPNNNLMYVTNYRDDSVSVIGESSTSFDFGDIGLGGTTTGTINSFGDQTLTLEEIINPRGVFISAIARGGSTPAEITACNGASQFLLNEGDKIAVTCSSATIEVINGSVEIKFIGVGGKLVTTILNEGNSITFFPDTLTISAPATNSDVVIIIVDGMQILIAPGETIVIPVLPDNRPVGGDILPIDSTVLILANAQSTSWMIPLVLSVVGIGLFVVSRKSGNS